MSLTRLYSVGCHSWHWWCGISSLIFRFSPFRLLSHCFSSLLRISLEMPTPISTVKFRRNRFPCGDYAQLLHVPLELPFLSIWSPVHREFATYSSSLGAWSPGHHVSNKWQSARSHYRLFFSLLRIYLVPIFSLLIGCLSLPVLPPPLRNSNSSRNLHCSPFRFPAP